MTHDSNVPSQDKVVSASREIDAPAAAIFDLIADPARQPEWDSNDNLLSAPEGQRVRAVGEVFRTKLTQEGMIRVNHVVEFDEGHRIAWCPAEQGAAAPGHLWRWELDPIGDGRTKVTHTYDWSRLDDPNRLERARSTTPEMLQASLDRLAELAESGSDPAAG